MTDPSLPGPLEPPALPPAVTPPMQQAYPGAPPVPAGAVPPPPTYAPSPTYAPQYPPAQQHPQHSAAPDTRPRTLAITGFSLAVGGAVIGLVPPFLALAWLALLAGLVISIVALAVRSQGGKGFGLAGVIVSIVGWMLAIVLAVTSTAVFGWLGRAFDDRPYAAPYESYDGDPDDFAYLDATPPVVGETGVGRITDGSPTWWYVVIVDNPNTDAAFPYASVDVEAHDGSGRLLGSDTAYPVLLPGRNAVTGYLTITGQDAEVTELVVTPPSFDEAEPAGTSWTFTTGTPTVSSTDRSTTVTGTVQVSGGAYGGAAELVTSGRVAVLARGADGTILDVAIDDPDIEMTEGTYDVTFFETFPDGTEFEAFASQ